MAGTPPDSDGDGWPDAVEYLACGSYSVNNPNIHPDPLTAEPLSAYWSSGHFLDGSLEVSDGDESAEAEAWAASATNYPDYAEGFITALQEQSGDLDVGVCPSAASLIGNSVTDTLLTEEDHVIIITFFQQGNIHWGYDIAFPDPPPTPTPTPTPPPTPTPTPPPTPTPTPPPTPTPTPPPTPTPTPPPTPTPTPTPLEYPSGVDAGYGYGTYYHVSVHWNAVEDAARYTVERQTWNYDPHSWAGQWEDLGTTTATCLNDRSCEVAMTYQYHVIANPATTDTLHCASLPSAPDSATTPPMDPAGFMAEYDPGDGPPPPKIDLSWTTDTIHDGCYLLYRATEPFPNQSGALISSPNYDVTRYHDTDLILGNHYYYALMRHNAECNSDHAETADAIAVGIDKLQWNNQGTWMDVTGPLAVAVGGSIEFRAVPKPGDATFPADHPIWGGTSGATGTGATKSVTFSDKSAHGADYKTVTAECGNTVGANVMAMGKVWLDSVSFAGSGYHPLVRDDNSTYGSPQWDDNSTPFNGNATDTGDREYPLCYTRGTTMTASLTWRLETSNPGIPIKVKGTGPVGFGTASGSPAGNTMGASLKADAPNAVKLLEPMTIDWQYSLDDGATWSDAGTSDNLVYVTLGDPLTDNYRSLIDIGCRNADGATTASQVLNGVWGAFQSKNSIKRTSDSLMLTYYGYYDTNHNGQYDSGVDIDRNSPALTGVTDAMGLIQTGNGQCHSWADLMTSALYAQGIVSVDGGVVDIVGLNAKTGIAAFAIKDWSKNGSSEPWTPISYDAGVDGAQAATPSAGEAADAAGAPGQGNSPNPPSGFGNHFIVGLISSYPSNNVYYDPSYGKGPYADRKEYEDEAFYGYIKSNDFKLYMLPSNNNNASNHADEICDYSQ